MAIGHPPKSTYVHGSGRRSLVGGGSGDGRGAPTLGAAAPAPQHGAVLRRDPVTGIATRAAPGGSYSDGQARMTVRDSSRDSYPTPKQHREALRGDPRPKDSNPVVHSKATRRYGKDGARLDATFSSTGEQPAKIHGRELASGLYSREVHPPGVGKPEQVGYATDGSGKHTMPSYPNRPPVKSGSTEKHAQTPEHLHRVGAESRPSGRTISK